MASVSGTVATRLKLADPERAGPVIEHAVIRSHRIMTAATAVLAYEVLHCLETDQDIPAFWSHSVVEQAIGSVTANYKPRERSLIALHAAAAVCCPFANSLESQKFCAWRFRRAAAPSLPRGGARRKVARPMMDARDLSMAARGGGRLSALRAARDGPAGVPEHPAPDTPRRMPAVRAAHST